MTRGRLIFEYQDVILFGSIEEQCRIQETFALIINFNLITIKKVTRYRVVQPNGMLDKKLLGANV